MILVGRSEAKTAACARSLNSPYFCADFTRLEEVRSLAARLRDTCPRIDVLANNAGGIMGKREMTVDGFEKTLQEGKYRAEIIEDGPNARRAAVDFRCRTAEAARSSRIPVALAPGGGWVARISPL